MVGSAQTATPEEQVLVFGAFQLFRTRKLLLESGQPVRLGDRALDILCVLVDRAGEVVSKRELMKLTWPDTVVEESNLRVHITAIRKVLGGGNSEARHIINVSGRGYSFISPVGRTPTPGVAPQTINKVGGVLPIPITRTIGRERTVSAIVELIRRRRLVTIAGPAGVGKSTVAVSVASRIHDMGEQRVCFVDLAAVQEPALVAASLATAVGISALTEDPIGSLVACLADMSVLILLDNCEHLIERAAECAERILKETSAVNILATSREPLLAEGECLYPLPPLESPPESPNLAPARALEYPAVQLFMERASNGIEHFSLTPANVCAVAGICRQLDGIPLAIELVAARVDLFGIENLAKRLGERMVLLSKGRRTAHSRHQSPRAMLDWSHEILPLHEQVILRRLAAFRGGFSMESAAAVVATGSIAELDVFDGIVSLAGKSLVTTDVMGQTVRYRLLHLTRMYAAEKLAESGEFREMLSRHAAWYRVVFEQAEADWELMTRSQWTSRYGWMIDDVRAALEWAFSEHGDIGIGASLTAASLPFGFQLSLIDEYKKRAERALQSIEHASPPQPVTELRLNLALGMLYQNTSGAAERVRAVLGRAIVLARECRDARYLIEPHVNLMVFNLECGDHHAALSIAKQLSRVASQSGDPLAVLIADRAGAQAHHFAGDHAQARVLAERVLRDPAKAIPLIYSQTSVDRRVSMRIVLARILWLEGHPHQAAELAAECVEMASSDSPFAICQALGLAACPIALWIGDDSAAHSYTASLLDYSRRYTLARWHTLGQCFAAELAGSQPALVQARPVSQLQSDLLATVNESWIERDTVVRAEQGLCGWCAPEILRIRARMLPRDAGSESAYRKALAVAHQQQALSWELRIVMSLAELQQNDAAYGALRTVYDRFTEGHGTADLQRARSMLEG